MRTALTTALFLATAAHAAEPPDDASIKTALEAVTGKRPGLAGVVAVLDETGTRVITTGEATGDTRFEVGSITKALCGVLLAEMVERGEVKLEDPVQKYLPATLKVPQRDGGGFEKALTKRVLQPLGMTQTSTSSQGLAPGHDAAGAAVRAWDFDALAGAGAVRSSAKDLLKLLSVAAGATSTGPKEALVRIAQPLRAGPPPLQSTLGWFSAVHGGHTIVEKDGMTAGTASWVGFDAEQHTAVVVWVNAALPVNSLGLRVMSGSLTAKPRQEVALAPAALDAYAGVYELSPQAKLTVRRKGDGLTVQLTGQGALELKASAPDEFYLTVVDAQLSFQRDGGKVSAVVLHQNGIDQRALRVADAPEAAPAEPKEVQLTAAQLDAYLGTFQLAPSFSLVVTREGAQLFVQATGQQRLPVFAEAVDRFFYRVVPAQLRFEREGGAVTGVTLLQNGQAIPGKRTK
jgi:CubicO group peptidase (beta-lactamase class C family)